MPTSGIVITNTFNSESGFVPASQLDTNFGQCVTALNTLQTFGNYYVDTGSANAMAITVASPLIVAYTAGLPLQVKVAAANVGTGATTININSIGTRNVTYPNAAALIPGQLAAGAIISLMYDGTNFQYLGPVFGSISSPLALTATGISGVGLGATSMYWSVSNYVATITLTTFTGPSNANTLYLTGLPSFLYSPRPISLPVPDSGAEDNGAALTVTTGHAAILFISNSSALLQFCKDGGSASFSNWSTSGTKGLTTNMVFTYPLL